MNPGFCFGELANNLVINAQCLAEAVFKTRDQGSSCSVSLGRVNVTVGDGIITKRCFGNLYPNNQEAIASI